LVAAKIRQSNKRCKQICDGQETCLSIYDTTNSLTPPIICSTQRKSLSQSLIIKYPLHLAATRFAATSTSVDIHARARRLIYFRRVNDSLLDVCRQAVECLLHIDVALCRDFHEGDAEFVCELLAALGGDDALVFPVAFVADENLVYAFGSMLFDVRKPGTNIC
jgi:hypothetical protein